MAQIKRILVSQPKPSAAKSPYYDLATKYGVDIDFKPFIQVEGITAKEFRTQKINIADHTAIIFTAKTAVDNFFRLCHELRITMNEDMKYFFLSEKISLYIQNYVQYRKRRIFFGEEGKLDSFVDVIKKHKNEKYLIITSDVYEANKTISDHKTDIISMLSQTDITMEKAVMYRTVSVDFTKDPDFNYDMLVFFSPTGIASLYNNFPDYEQGKTVIACFGPTTIKAAQEKGLDVQVQAPSPEFLSMPAAIEAYLKK